MKRILILLCFLALPIQLFAINNFQLNGETVYLVTALPTQLVMTGDFAQTGNRVGVQIYFDVNNSGAIDAEDILVEYFIITDGIGWIRDPESPLEDIPGDETGIDGQMKTTFPFNDDVQFFSAGQFLLKATDSDKSTATATLKVALQPIVPYIYGKITDQLSGSPLAGVVVTGTSEAEEVYDSVVGITNETGDYFLSVTPGNWKVMVYDFMQNKYQASDSLPVTVAENENSLLNVQLQPYTSFVTGTLKKNDGTPVPGIQIMAVGIENEDFSYTYSDVKGEYKVGVKPGKIVVSASMLMNILMPQSAWPDGYYIDPKVDSLVVPEGQTVPSDFTFKPYSSFVEGDCKAGVRGLSGVEITAMILDLQKGILEISITASDLRGHYKLGVIPGRISMLSANKEGYDLTSPAFGYTNFTVSANQTVTGKDFQFTEGSEGMSIAGIVTYGDGSVASGIYVAAIEEISQAENSFLISGTNSSGQYEFMNLFEGYWKVGVYQDGFVSEPAIYYTGLYPGYKITDANFVLGPSSAVQTTTQGELPQKFYLAQNYPNPFNPGAGRLSTQIKFYIERDQNIEIRLYNVQGQLVKVLQSGILNPGQHQVAWDGRNARGEIVPSGVYFYKIPADNKIQSRRLLIVR